MSASITNILRRWPAVAILGVLIAAGALGLWLSGGPSPDAPQLSEQPTESPTYVPDDRPLQARSPDGRARESVQRFVDSGASPCTFAASDAFVYRLKDEFPSLAVLANHVDLIVIGRVTGWTLSDVRRGSMASRIFAQTEIEEVLAGAVADYSIDVDLWERIIANDLRRDILDLDSCNSGRLLLFVHQLHGGGFALGGWVGLDGPTAGESEGTKEFHDYVDADGDVDEETLVSDVRKTIQAQAMLDLPKGLLWCEFRRSSPERYRAPAACPGERFNPSQFFELDNVVEAEVGTTDPGPSTLAVSTAILGAADDNLAALLGGLDVTDVSIEPLGLGPPDLILVMLRVDVPGQPRRSHQFSYSPSEQVVYLSHGQFAAPAALRQAMKPYLAP